MFRVTNVLQRRSRAHDVTLKVEGVEVDLNARPRSKKEVVQVLTSDGGPSGRGTLLFDIKLKVPPQYELLILKRNSYFNC